MGGDPRHIGRLDASTDFAILAAHGIYGNSVMKKMREDVSRTDLQGHKEDADSISDVDFEVTRGHDVCGERLVRRLS